MSQKPVQDEFSQPLAGDQVVGEPNQGRHHWSMSTIYAARPNPKFNTRAKAEAWNLRYTDTPKLQVDPNEYREMVPERTREEIEANLDRLKKLSSERSNLKIVDPWDRPE